MKIVLHCLLGFFSATAIFWGGLFVWGTLTLSPNDSYWDRTPYAADIFFACWMTTSVLAAIFAARRARRKERDTTGR